MGSRTPKVAIVDYALGNLFSVKHACDHVGLDGAITSCKNEVLAADAVILPGVGAFGDAMDNLRRLDLVSPLRDLAQAGKPLIGICLGQQLLMSESYEFGRHQGLSLFEGPVVRFENPQGPHSILKVPQVGWNRIHRPPALSPRLAGADPWLDTPLQGIAEGESMYFVHSFYVQPADTSVVLSTTRYGHIEFCSGLRRENVIAFQYHPERSGVQGMRIYQNLAAMIRQRNVTEDASHAA
jgi:glutamine amidotransferase